jgi:NAD(P)H-dependent FMN reductase
LERKGRGGERVRLPYAAVQLGCPAALKNAIDHLYREWRDKPAAIVSYGGHGGGKCASQLREVLSGIKIRVVPEMPGLTLAKAVIEANPGHLDAGVAFADQRRAIARALQALVA